MYTVVKFTSETLPDGVIESLGEALNAVVPGAFTGLRHAGDGFACQIADSDDWDDHRAEILGFIRRTAPVIRQATVGGGVDICVDVAIEPEDIQKRVALSVTVDPTLAGCLAEAGAILTFSIYGPSNAS